MHPAALTHASRTDLQLLICCKQILVSNMIDQRVNLQMHSVCMAMRFAGHWTEDMRTDALVPAKLDRRDLKVRSMSC
jgi:hypothetical protein